MYTYDSIFGCYVGERPNPLVRSDHDQGKRVSQTLTAIPKEEHVHIFRINFHEMQNLNNKHYRDSDG